MRQTWHDQVPAQGCAITCQAWGTRLRSFRRALGLAVGLTLIALNPVWASTPWVTGLQAGERTIDQATILSPRRPFLAHVRFCAIYPEQCRTYEDQRDSMRTAQDHFNEIQRVNWAVNRAITARPDEGFDSWDIDVTEGDCDDFALQKRADLIARGWPTDRLRLAITRLPEGIWHAVLLVRIEGVDYALDNLSTRVQPWDETPYEYLMLQGHDNPKAWHDINPLDLSEARN